MKNLLSASIFTLLSLCIFSQKSDQAIPSKINFKDGTTKSVLISEPEITSSKIISYKTSSNSSSQPVTPQLAESISANDNSFFLKSFTINDESYFLNLVVGGAADLYYYIDKSNTMKYVVYTPEFGYRELTKWKSSIKKEGKEFNKETKEFLGVLSLIFSDCGQDISLENIKLSLKSLSKSFISYNECKDQLDFKSSEINKKSKIRIGLLGGIDYNSLKTNTPVASDGKGETNFTIGTEIILIPSFLNSKLTPLLSLNYTKTGGEANYLSTPEFDKLKLDFQLVELYAGLRYNLLSYSSKVNPFIGISMGKSFILNHESSILKTSSDGTSTPEPLYYGNPYKNLSNDMRLGFHYQAGINYQLAKNQGFILKLDYSSMYEGLGEFQFNRFRCEAGYYFNL